MIYYDHLYCNNCDTEVLTSRGAEICPNCMEEGCLSWKDEENQTFPQEEVIFVRKLIDKKEVRSLLKRNGYKTHINNIERVYSEIAQIAEDIIFKDIDVGLLVSDIGQNLEKGDKNDMS